MFSDLYTTLIFIRTNISHSLICGILIFRGIILWQSEFYIEDLSIPRSCRSLLINRRIGTLRIPLKHQCFPSRRIYLAKESFKTSSVSINNERISCTVYFHFLPRRFLPPFLRGNFTDAGRRAEETFYSTVIAFSIFRSHGTVRRFLETTVFRLSLFPAWKRAARLRPLCRPVITRVACISRLA